MLTFKKARNGKTEQVYIKKEMMVRQCCESSTSHSFILKHGCFSVKHCVPADQDIPDLLLCRELHTHHILSAEGLPPREQTYVSYLFYYLALYSFAFFNLVFASHFQICLFVCFKCLRTLITFLLTCSNTPRWGILPGKHRKFQPLSWSLLCLSFWLFLYLQSVCHVEQQPLKVSINTLIELQLIQRRWTERWTERWTWVNEGLWRKWWEV